MAASKPTAVHFTLIFFVMLSLFLGVFAYMYYGEYKTALADAQEAREQFNTTDTALKNAEQTLTEAQQILGYQYSNWGSPDDPNSVIGALTVDFRQVAGSLPIPPQEQSVREMLAALRTQYNSAKTTMEQAQQGEQQSRSDFQRRTNNQQQEVDTARADLAKETAQLQKQIAEHNEQTRQLREDRDKWHREFQDAQSRYEQIKDEYTQAQQDWQRVKLNMLETIAFQKDRIAKLENISFEKPDGEVQLVDSTTGYVWINRGKVDHLRPQVTFSVYVKDHRGIARSISDIKAKLEVMSVDSTTAKCRVLEEDLTRPIAPGDPIYSPLWHSGMVEEVAFVGIIDLDGDGKSDRELLKEIVDINNARIRLQIDDKGYRVPAESHLTVHTKFLVEGEIPDPNDFAGLDEKQDEIKRMMEERSALLDEAAENGVQIISLNEFLIYMGFRSQQRIFKPGQDRTWNLGAGSHSTTVDETYIDRTSTGRTSKLFQNRRLRTQDVSSGQTSGYFRGNN